MSARTNDRYTVIETTRTNHITGGAIPDIMLSVLTDLFGCLVDPPGVIP
jgi:hypothetical protein